MRSEILLETLEVSPVIAAIKSEELISVATKSECSIIFLLCGDICNLPSLVKTLKQADKIVFVHIDLVLGLSSHEAAVRYIKNNTLADGIISTKSQLVKCGKDNGLLAIQRFFALDSLALSNIMKQKSEADIIEVLPAISPKIIEKITKTVRTPIIVGGLIDEKTDAIQMLSAGAVGISTTTKAVWSA